MTTGKPLTTPPTNLKEAIDWVLRVSGGDGYGGSDVIELVEALKERDVINVDNLYNDLQSHINTLANALKNFIGYAPSGTSGSDFKIDIGGNGIIKPGEIYSKTQPISENKIYTSAYKGSWFTDVNVGYPQNPTETEITCARIFFTAIRLIYEGLTELYYNCKKEWSSQSLSGSGHSDTLNQFMTTNGFSGTQLNTSMKGDIIASQSLQDFNEFTTAYTAAGDNPSLDVFRSQLEQNASTSPSNYPLSTLYILATYAYVQSTSPGTPSFAGYSGLTALAGGAYGFNLGGLGTFVSALLA
ncbi:variant erythrocyte surface antigen-1 family protein [Babesia caballi]|uniref:Variant erythrocyte surface antigen-1 family protein n=1 Tax=Babesia caballi TaxID=5871 RepID=A0AAV4LNN1_BABCB|nr:variant erythrocyte surface antigen-1 family protein [Babesia caballi]